MLSYFELEKLFFILGLLRETHIQGKVTDKAVSVLEWQ